MLIAVLFGCKAPEKIFRASDHKVPASFNGSRDTTTQASLTFDRFFTDRDLVKLIDTAMHQNADLLIAAQRVEVARAMLRQHRGALFPSLDIGISGGGRQYGRHTIDGVGNAASPEIPSPFTPDYFAGVTSSWELDVWGKLRNRKKAAKLRYLSTEAGRNFMATNLVAEVAYRYYTLVSLDREMDIVLKNIKLQERALEIVKVQKEAGKATELAVKQFGAQLITTQAMEYELKTQITATENELNFLLGRYAQPVARNKSEGREFADMTGVGVPSGLVSHRPDIVQAELELRASEADVNAARAAFLPSFNISALAGYNAYSTAMFFNPASLVYGFVGGLSAPVFNRNQIKASYDQAVAEHKGAYLQYGKTVMNAVFEVCTGVDEIAGLQAQYTLNEKAATMMNEAVAISNDIYLAGYANYLEVITAQKNALDAELKVVQTGRKMLFARVNLYRALGGR